MISRHANLHRSGCRHRASAETGAAQACGDKFLRSAAASNHHAYAAVYRASIVIMPGRRATYKSDPRPAVSGESRQSGSCRV